MARIKEARFFDNDEFFRDGQPPYEKYHEQFSDVWLRKILGDATPNYMYSTSAPRRLKEYNPKMKIIISLREPVSRAFSQWNMERQNGMEPLSFTEVIRKELSSEPGLGHDYVRRGFYVQQLERIWEIFPKEQTLIFKSEDLRNNGEEIFNHICRFLGVSERKNIPKIEIHKRSYEAPMSDEDRKLLQEIYCPEIKKLERLLNWDCSGWLAD